MTREEFGLFCKDMCAYFNRRTDEVQMDLWFREIHWVSGHTLDWIKESMFQDLDRFPINFPKTIRTYWGRWKHEHPKMIIKDQVTCDAPGCRNGFIHVEKDGIRSVGYCDQCAVSRHVAKPDSNNLTNLAVLNDAGFREW